MKRLVSAVIIVIMVITLMSPALAASGNKNKKSNVKITLDGYFDDWADKPATYFKFNGADAQQYATVKWYTDDQNLYLYIKMAEVEYFYLSSNTIEYHVNGVKKGQFLLAPDQPTTGRACIYEYSIDYRPLTQDGYVVRGNRDGTGGIKGDQAEFRIPLSIFAKKLGNVSNFELKFPNLGDQAIVIHTGSTGPYVGIALCILASLAGVFIYKRKKTA